MSTFEGAGGEFSPACADGAGGPEERGLSEVSAVVDRL